MYRTPNEFAEPLGNTADDHSTYLHEPLGYPDGVNRYQLELGNPLFWLDPDGLEAWPHKNNWTDKKDGKTYRQHYEEWVVRNAANYDVEKTKRWTGEICSAAPTDMLLDFAEENGLPVTFQDQQGNDHSSWAFESKAEYRKTLLGGGTKAMISPDTLGNVGKTEKEWINDGDPRAPKNVTAPLDPKDVRPGDMVNGAAYGEKGRPGHTIAITKVSGSGNNLRMDTCETAGVETDRTVDEILNDKSVTGWEPRFRRWHDHVFKPYPTKPKSSTQPANRN